MMGFDKDKNAVGDSKNFKYLDELIHSGAKEIVLDSNIILGGDEKSEYKDGIKLDVDDMVIDGNSHSIDAQGKARIFYCTGKNIVIKNIALKNGFVKKSGGAISNYNGELTITNSTLTGNTAKDDGGAIYNEGGELTITESTLNNNTAKNYGGAIENYGGSLTIIESALKGNTAKRVGGAIYNNEHCELSITESTFNDNSAQEDGGAIYNADAKLCIIDSTFNENGIDIFNDGLIVCKENISKIIHLHNNGRLYHPKSLKNNQKDFTYLNELIKAKTNEIKLENDIILNIANNEQETFKNGIEIDRENLVIDGNGHTICAQFLTRIFNCSGKNIMIKNITLKNGCAKDGGAIYNKGDGLRIADSSFTENMAMDYGGAIYNIAGELTITESTLTGNTAKNVGGAIYLYKSKKYESKNCTFKDNKPDDVYEDK